MLSGCIQAFMMNGPSTNPPDCIIDNQYNCWSWGLTASQYYYMIFAICTVLVIPIFFMKEPDASKVPYHSFPEHLRLLWETLQNFTTLSLIIYIMGINIFAATTVIIGSYLQYYVIQLTNLQSGISKFKKIIII